MGGKDEGRGEGLRGKKGITIHMIHKLFPYLKAILQPKSFNIKWSQIAER